MGPLINKIHANTLPVTKKCTEQAVPVAPIKECKSHQYNASDSHCELPKNIQYHTFEQQSFRYYAKVVKDFISWGRENLHLLTMYVLNKC